jgi:hypothetical protein
MMWGIKRVCYAITRTPSPQQVDPYTGTTCFVGHMERT